MKLYFAHPVTDYDTPFEALCRCALAAQFPDVLDPNGPEHDAAYRAEGWPYFDRLVETCQAVAFTRMPDGRISAGVAKEVASFFERGLPVYEIGRSDVAMKPLASMPVSSVMTIDETRAAIRSIRAAREAA